MDERIPLELEQGKMKLSDRKREKNKFVNSSTNQFLGCLRHQFLYFPQSQHLEYVISRFYWICWKSNPSCFSCFWQWHISSIDDSGSLHKNMLIYDEWRQFLVLVHEAVVISCWHFGIRIWNQNSNILRTKQTSSSNQQYRKNSNRIFFIYFS